MKIETDFKFVQETLNGGLLVPLNDRATQYAREVFVDAHGLGDRIWVEMRYLGQLIDTLESDGYSCVFSTY